MDNKFSKPVGTLVSEDMRRELRDISALLCVAESDVIRQALRLGLPLVRELGIRPPRSGADAEMMKSQ